ncbi:hypothetical protein QYM36_002564 [Artemia franciscana]|uniref:Uncharacterized protein n=1 Tax=Artemia franciscana TaxID=6661 RepID=A0AA88LHN8_ARTSF|nr:hypothetical protein QYM36_002564 [Artemia franciscana]
MSFPSEHITERNCKRTENAVQDKNISGEIYSERAGSVSSGNPLDYATSILANFPDQDVSHAGPNNGFSQRLPVLSQLHNSTL